MTGESVLLEIKGSVAYVIMNRPDVHNAFDEHVIERLSTILDELSGNGEVKCVVFQGKGKSFSAGADLNWMKRAAAFTEEQNRADARKLAHMLHQIYNLPKLTIACVQGAALGGGLGLVACCDIAIADADAKFGFSEVKLGLVPATIGPYVMAAIGPRHARRYFQTGERFDGVTAQRIGLVHEIAARPEDMEYILHAILKDVATAAPLAMVTAKKLCVELQDKALSKDLIEGTAACIAQVRSGREAQEGLAAFLEKRRPSWGNN